MTKLVVPLLCLSLLADFLTGSTSRGDELLPAPSTTDLQALLEQQAGEIQALRQRLDMQEASHWPASESEPGGQADYPVFGPQAVVLDALEPDCPPGGSAPYLSPGYYSDYDNGFLAVRPASAMTPPFELKINGWIQFRHHAFSRAADTWTDNTGLTRPVRNRNAFDIERGRLIFSGYAQDPRLTYFLQLDGDTDGRHAVDFLDYWWAWRFSDRLQVQMGKRKVTAVRQWLVDSRRTRFVDRPMACEFFRPNRTVGVYGIGKVGETGHYEVMLGNGYDTVDIPNRSYDNSLTFAATNYFDPWGYFGDQFVDYDLSCDPLLRVGHSFVYAPNAGRTSGYVMLADGTLTTTPGAIAPGVTLTDEDILLYSLDAAIKFRGWSLDAEAFYRWIEDLRANGPLPVTDIFQTGMYVEGGRFLIPSASTSTLVIRWSATATVKPTNTLQG